MSVLHGVSTDSGQKSQFVLGQPVGHPFHGLLLEHGPFQAVGPLPARTRSGYKWFKLVRQIGDLCSTVCQRQSERLSNFLRNGALSVLALIPLSRCATE